jgi:opacity protein-like surface antigen
MTSISFFSRLGGPALLFLVFLVGSARAQQNEIGLLVGRLEPSDRELTTLIPVDAAMRGSVAYQLSYASRLLDGKAIALYGEMVITGAPRSKIRTNSLLTPNAYSSLFFTPGARLKLLPGARLSPFLTGGLGLGRYVGGETGQTGQPIPGSQSNLTWALTYGGGVDLHLAGPLALRGELRHFLTGNPTFGPGFVDRRQDNLFLGGGLVIRW